MWVGHRDTVLGGGGNPSIIKLNKSLKNITAEVIIVLQDVQMASLMEAIMMIMKITMKSW